MLLWNGENFGNVWWPPPDFTFSLNGKVVVSYTHSTITITPSEPHFESHIYTDGDLRNEYQNVDIAPNFGLNVSTDVDKSNLQSANALFNNTITRAAITVSNPFVTTITDFRPHQSPLYNI